MRDIKFRAWDKCNEKMYQVQEMELQDTCRHVVVEGYDCALVDPILLQYTGLRDKNGKEIYEGDIIYWKDLSKASDGTLEDNVVVFWDDEHLRWSAESLNVIGVYQKLYDYSDVDEIKVIGSIYENKELLEELR